MVTFCRGVFVVCCCGSPPRAWGLALPRPARQSPSLAWCHVAEHGVEHLASGGRVSQGGVAVGLIPCAPSMIDAVRLLVLTADFALARTHAPSLALCPIDCRAKGYLKAIKERLEKDDPERVPVFTVGCGEFRGLGWGAEQGLIL